MFLGCSGPLLSIQMCTYFTFTHNYSSTNCVVFFSLFFSFFNPNTYMTSNPTYFLVHFWYNSECFIGQLYYLGLNRILYCKNVFFFWYVHDKQSYKKHMGLKCCKYSCWRENKISLQQAIRDMTKTAKVQPALIKIHSWSVRVCPRGTRRPIPRSH